MSSPPLIGRRLMADCKYDPAKFLSFLLFSRMTPARWICIAATSVLVGVGIFFFFVAANEDGCRHLRASQQSKGFFPFARVWQTPAYAAIYGLITPAPPTDSNFGRPMQSFCSFSKTCIFFSVHLGIV